MVVRIDGDLCTTCGSCMQICPQIFSMQDESVVVQIGEKPVQRQNAGACREAAEACPAEAIAID